jgi:hypothetical protein
MTVETKQNIFAIKLDGVEVKVENVKGSDYIVIDENQKEISDGNVYLTWEKGRFNVTDTVNPGSKVMGRVIQSHFNVKSL